jgi:ribosomal protein S18 acetylase RimI-like enzyme
MYDQKHWPTFRRKTTPMGALGICTLGRENWAQFKALRLKAIEGAPFALWPTYREEEALTAEQVQSRIEPGPHQIVFGAFDGGRLVGIAGLRREKLEQLSHRGTIWGVAVDPQRRKEGIGKKVLQRLITHARDEGLLQIQLAVGVENAGAQALYRSLGFQSFGIEPRAMRVGERFYDEEHMVLRLDE